MKTPWSVLASILLLTGTVEAQDLDFLPLVLERAALDADENMGRRHGAIYVDIASILAAVHVSDLEQVNRRSVSSVLRSTGNRPFVLVDSIGEVLERGPFTSTAYQRIAAGFRGVAPVADADGMIRWIRDDGVYLRVQSVRPWSRGYVVTIFPSSTYPHFTGVHGRPAAYYVQRLPTGWTITGPAEGPTDGGARM